MMAQIAVTSPSASMGVAPQKLSSRPVKSQLALPSRRPRVSRQVFASIDTARDFSWEVVGKSAAAIVLSVSLVVSEPVSAAGRSTISFQQQVNARALLREALPIDLSGTPLAVAEDLLEDIAQTLPRSAGTARSITGDSLKEVALERATADAIPILRKAGSVINGKREEIMSLIQPEYKKAAEAELAELYTGITTLARRLDSTTPPSLLEIAEEQERLLLILLDLETESVPRALADAVSATLPKGLEGAPVLRGRATVEIQLKLRKPGSPKGADATMRMVVDGFNAPLSAGNFIDLAASGAYNSTPVSRADGFVVQVGDDVKSARRIPLEVRYKNSPETLYGYDAENAGRRGGRSAALALPFSANGTVAVARDETDPESGGAAFFILLKESEVTPAGANVLDGRFSAFGYVVDNVELLQSVSAEDTIVSVKVLDGLQWLKNSKYAL